jgi:branched-chain amino acid aminotransferase
LHAIEALAQTLDIPFERRPIARTELVIADKLAICGTLAEVVPAKMVKGRPFFAQSHLLQELQARYFQAVRRILPHPDIKMTRITI